MLNHTEDILLNQINIEANSDPKRYYDVLVEDIDLDIYKGNLVIEDFSASPRFEYLDSLGEMPIALVDFSAPRIILKDFDISDFIFNGGIRFEGFITAAPVGTIILTGIEKEKRTATESPVAQLSTDEFPLIAIKNSVISQGSFNLIWGPDSTVLADIDSLNFNLRDIRVDSTTIDDPIPFHVDGFTLDIMGFEGDLMKYHKIKTGRILYQDQNEALEIDDIQLQPKHSQKQYHALKGYQSDWFAVTVKKLKIHGFDITRFAEDNQVYIDLLEIEKPNALIQRDRNVDLPPFKYKALPVSQIQNMPISLNLRSATVRNARVEYNEQPVHDTPPGKIFFENMNIDISNITNVPEEVAADKKMKLRANAKLMGAGNINLKMDFDLLEKDDRFYVDGVLDTMNFASLNPLTENLLLVHLDSGLAERMEFQFVANEDSAIGRMSFVYQNLRLEMFKETKEGRFKRLDFLNSIANTFMKSKNEGKRLQVGKIAFRRKKDRYLFNYLGKCIQTGLVETVVPEGEKKLFKIDGSLIK